MLNIKVILGSTRPNRFSEKVAAWLKETLPEKEGVTIGYLDLRDYPLPFLDLPVSPSQITDGNYPNEIVNKWAKEIKRADAFILIAPEYNHGPSAVLKNALDSVYYEWNKKAVAYIGYGGVGGARGIEQLREVAVELEMGSVRSAVHIMSPWFLLDDKGELKAGALDTYVKNAQAMLDELIWWGSALKAGREKSS